LLKQQYDQYKEDFMEIFKFRELVFELAFGDDAINKEYSDVEVLAKLREFSDTQLELVEVCNGFLEAKTCAENDECYSLNEGLHQDNINKSCLLIKEVVEKVEIS
jgi:hypothetical protein